MNNLEEKLKYLNKLSFRGPIGVFVVIGSFAFQFALLFVKIPIENKDSVNTAMGFVLMSLGIVIGYYFGSSKDKSDNDKAANVKDLLSDDSKKIANEPV